MNPWLIQRWKRLQHQHVLRQEWLKRWHRQASSGPLKGPGWPGSLQGPLDLRLEALVDVQVFGEEGETVTFGQCPMQVQQQLLRYIKSVAFQKRWVTMVLMNTPWHWAAPGSTGPVRFPVMDAEVKKNGRLYVTSECSIKYERLWDMYRTRQGPAGGWTRRSMEEQGLYNVMEKALTDCWGPRGAVKWKGRTYQVFVPTIHRYRLCSPS